MATLRQFNFSRSRTIQLLKNIPEDKWHIQPTGFSNNIHWNAGHIFVVTEMLSNKADKKYNIHYHEWADFFAPGTRPTDWKNPPPQPKEIIKALEEQRTRVRETFFGKYGVRASEPFSIGSHIMDSVESLLHFDTWHEGTHQGIIQSLNKVID